MTIKTVIFDLDDTLCDDTSAWKKCAYAAVMAGAHLLPKTTSVEMFAERFMRISEEYWAGTDYFTETRTVAQLRNDQFSQALAELGCKHDLELVTIMSDEYSRIRSTEIDLFPDAVPTLKKLRERGVSLVLITNGLESTHVPKVKALGLEPLFDHILIAGVLGFWKPDPKIFQRALTLTGASPEEAVMVGDNIISDVSGAQNAGIAAFWYNPYSKVRSENELSPRMGEIRSLAEILTRLSL
jgi:putative hydrolase of the HAD superfamily